MERTIGEVIRQMASGMSAVQELEVLAGVRSRFRAIYFLV
jgi:hypothetical protein